MQIACRATDALDQAIWQRKTLDNKSLVRHSDRGSQYLSIKYIERLAQAEIDLSVGTAHSTEDGHSFQGIVGSHSTRRWAAGLTDGFMESGLG
jgi:putative transposase